MKVNCTASVQKILKNKKNKEIKSYYRKYFKNLDFFGKYLCLIDNSGITFLLLFIFKSENSGEINVSFVHSSLTATKRRGGHFEKMCH